MHYQANKVGSHGHIEVDHDGGGNDNDAVDGNSDNTVDDQRRQNTT